MEGDAASGGFGVRQTPSILKAELLWMCGHQGVSSGRCLTQPGEQKMRCPSMQGTQGRGGGWTIQVDGERESVKMDKGTIIESEVGKPWKGKSHTCISCSLLTPAGRKISSQTSNNELPTTCSWWRQPQSNSLLSSMKQPPLLCALDLPMVCHRILVHNLVTKQHLDPLLVLGASHI